MKHNQQEGKGCIETPSNQAFKRVKFVTKVNLADIFGKFFILENVILQMPLSVIYQTCASFFWSTRRTRKKKNQKKEDVSEDLTTKLTERKEGNVETVWRFVKAIRRLKSLTKFAHNILREL